MGEFLAFVMIVFAAVWGSIFLWLQLKRFRREVEGDSEGGLLTELREDTRLLEARVERMEEELRFFRELHAPADPERLPPAEGDNS